MTKSDQLKFVNFGDDSSIEMSVNYFEDEIASCRPGRFECWFVIYFILMNLFISFIIYFLLVHFC